MSLEMSIQELNTNVAELRNVMVQFAQVFKVQPHVPAHQAAAALDNIAAKEAAQVVEEVAAAVEPTEQDIAEPITYDQVKEATLTFAKKKGKDAVHEMFARFDVDHASKLNPEQWGAYLSAVHAALEA